MKTSKLSLKNLFIGIALVVILNIVSHFVYQRFDLTADKRYTLSETSIKIISEIKEPLYVDVFLEGNFPGEFKKLQQETQQLLEEFKSHNSNIIFQFKNPIENQDESNGVIESFIQRGMLPVNVSVEDKGKQTQEIVFPWAIISYGEKGAKVPLLKNSMTASTAEKVTNSVQHLEYAFANAINTVVQNKSKKVAVLKGNKELQDFQIADFVKSVKENYYIGTFTLDSVSKKPNATLNALKKYDLAVIAKPTEAFTEEEKLVLDQFIINGGKTIWLVDNVAIEMDSLMQTGENLAYPRDLNLNDFFFKYGVRMQPSLIKDIMATPISLATGEQGSGTQYTKFPWFYSPMIYPKVTTDSQNTNAIISNLDGVRMEFCNPIELLNNKIKKTVLLQSSPYSKPIGTPIPVSLAMVEERPEQKEFNGGGNIPVAVLLEGDFKSMYQNRVLPFKEPTFKENGTNNSMIVISDGDVIKNQLDKNGMPLEMGFDKWTNSMYANKEFMLNSVNYLLDDNGLINIRNKVVVLPLLDKQQVYDDYTITQIINVGLPIVILGLFGLLFTFLRKRKYSK
jgi:gliding-associated putative ABC transporter substrate-binding component GldG